MSEELDYTPDLYTLIDDDGVEKTFEMLDAMEVDGEQYYALVEYAEEADDVLENDGEVVILKSVMEGDEEIMASIEDEAEYERIGTMFMARLENLYEFEEDGCGCGSETCDHE
ncbi:MAG: DUF1292 domain-containing protein [Oscillospiraceae bacterium]